MLNPCTREMKVRTGGFLKGKLISGHGLFLPARANNKRRTGKISGAFFRDVLGLWTGGVLARAPGSRQQSETIGITLDIE